MSPVRMRLAVASSVSALVVVTILAAPPASGWDSKKFAAQPIHPTHSYLTEHGIGQLKAQFPELGQYEAVIVEGANQELHELPTSGTLHGIDLEAKRKQHKGTNEGCDDIQGWWDDTLAAYKAGNKERAYFLLGIMLHMVEDMGVPAHANKVYHQGNLTEFDNFESLGVLNWKPSFNDINRTDPAYAEPWKYYAFSQDWTHTDAPNYTNRDAFSKTWFFASNDEKTLFSNREGRTATVVMWAMKSASKAFQAR